MKENDELIDLSKRSQKELILKLIDKMDDLESKVDKYVEKEMKGLTEKIHELDKSQAIIKAKAAAYASVAAVIISVISRFIQT